MTRSTAAAVVIVLVMLAALTFLYGVPSGRRARRDAVRVFRLARNATGIYPLPVLTIRMWGGTRPNPLLIEVYESGRVVVWGRGGRIERQLTREATETIIQAGRTALGDFSAAGCGTKAGGLNAELYVLIDGARSGSLCRDASGWPRGAETKHLFSEIDRHVPGVLGSL